MAEQAALRRPALDGTVFGADRVQISVLTAATRVSLRAPAASVAALSSALGVDLPTKPKTSASAGSRTVLWLGPDEWLILDEGTLSPLDACRAVSDLHSAVDVSHRNVAFAVIGKGAAAVINAGCPQDLSLAAFPVGAASRTIFGKIEIVLLRIGEEAFRLECWRSFSDYAFTLLSEAARDAH